MLEVTCTPLQIQKFFWGFNPQNPFKWCLNEATNIPLKIPVRHPDNQAWSTGKLKEMVLIMLMIMNGDGVATQYDHIITQL